MAWLENTDSDTVVLAVLTQPSAEVTFKYLNSEIVGLEESSLELRKAPAASGPWTVQATTLDAAKNTVRTTVDGFSYFALVSGPLSVGEWSMLED